MSRAPSLRQRLGLKIFSKIYADRVQKHELDTLFWECTLRCNLACRHCGSDCRAVSAVQDMPKEDFFRVLDTQITPHVDTTHTLVILSGGEVLVRPDLEEIGHALYQRRYPWGMVTNALALDEARFRSLLQAGMHSLTISLDGLEGAHTYLRGNPQSFARATEAIRRAAATDGLAFDVVTCVNGRNLAQLDELKTLLIALGVKAWRVFTIFPVGRAANDASLQLSDEQFTQLMEYICRVRAEGKIRLSYGCEGFLGKYEARVRDTFYHCNAGVSVASIRVDGSISGCTSIRTNYHQGNIYQDDFWDVWQHRFQPFRNREWAKTGECATCKMFSFCLGNGMHLRDDEGRLLLCHYQRIVDKK